jgi:hypothetical protein
MTTGMGIQPAFGKILFDLGGSYSTQQVITSQTDYVASSAAEAGLYVPIDTKERFFLGSSYFSGTLTLARGSATDVFSTYDFLLGAKWVVDKQGMITLMGGFGPYTQANAKISAAATTDLLSGTSSFGRFIIAPHVTSRLNIGVSFTYWTISFVSLETSSSVSRVHYSSSYLTPGLIMSYAW